MSEAVPHHSETPSSRTFYALGHSAPEMKRLILQAELLAPITERLLRSAGIGDGMRVLDLGCGAGDVSMLAAKLVGPSGSVLGIDRNGEVLQLARERAGAAGFGSIEFEKTPLDTFAAAPHSFDLVVGRYILIHQAEPVSLLKAAARLVRPGGVLAFHEIIHRHYYSSSTPLLEQTLEWLYSACRASFLSPDASERLPILFFEAGLDGPEMSCEALVDSKEARMVPWIVDTFRSLLPAVIKYNIADAVTVDIDTLEDRLRTALSNTHDRFLSPLQVCAWTTI
jgi:SAM-dependent methyltransferase